MNSFEKKSYVDDVFGMEIKDYIKYEILWHLYDLNYSKDEVLEYYILEKLEELILSSKDPQLECCLDGVRTQKKYYEDPNFSVFDLYPATKGWRLG